MDFRDGTGPAPLLPNDVLQVFRDAEDFTLYGKRRNLKYGESGGDEAYAREGLSSKGLLPKRVVHVESATTGTFFKVSRPGEQRSTTVIVLRPQSNERTLPHSPMRQLSTMREQETYLW